LVQFVRDPLRASRVQRRGYQGTGALLHPRRTYKNRFDNVWSQFYYSELV
jgi:hypothetical protein